MLYRNFPKIPGLSVSALGFGCMRLPVVDGDESRIDVPAADAVLEAALEAGVNYVDTAWPYHREGSERWLGQTLERLEARDRVLLATKSPSWLVKERGDWRRFLDEQLARLRTDHVDFYLIHALDGERWKTVLATGGLEELAAARAAGLVRHVGFSFHDSLDAFKTIIDGWDGWEFCQVQYNYLDDEIQAGTAGIEFADARGIGTIIMEPLRGGALAAVPDEVKAMFAGYGVPRMPAEWALRFAWDRQEVVTVLSGMNSVGQVWENAAVASSARPNMITRVERDILRSARDFFLARTAVPCTTCGYCMPCPSGVVIPGVFELWNSATMFGRSERNAGWYRNAFMSKARGGDSCTNCGACVSKCPQGIDIPAMMPKAHADLTS